MGHGGWLVDVVVGHVAVAQSVFDKDKIKDKIDELIYETPNAYPHVSVDDVARGIAQTKRNKKDSKSILYTDHFINSNLQLRVFLSMLFSALIVHGFTPNDFNEATLFPLIKKQTQICQ